MWGMARVFPCGFGFRRVNLLPQFTLGIRAESLAHRLIYEVVISH